MSQGKELAIINLPDAPDVLRMGEIEKREVFMEPAPSTKQSLTRVKHRRPEETLRMMFSTGSRSFAVRRRPGMRGFCASRKRLQSALLQHDL